MLRPIALLLLVTPFAGGAALAQDGLFIVPCDACRHPIAHPEDYVNHAFNQIYGPDGWMTFDQADDFFILGPQGLRVYVDVDFVFLGIGIKGLRLPFWPTNQLKFTLVLPDGRLYEAIRMVFLSPLPVPADMYDPLPEPGDGDSPAHDDSEGDDGEDAEWDAIDDEPGEPGWDDGDDYVGVTGIEDPDEYGNFPDTEWCEEC